MGSLKKIYKDINLIRLFSCMSVLLYHFDFLKGGYLAVCVFFVLSGYLSCVSLFKKEQVSLLSYYKERFLKVYFPLILVVFITISVLSFFQTINWFNLKPETTSVLLGYNNFWQLNANLDYFARHVNSPFMHLWYISILLQFELIFPFVFIFLKKIGDKFKKFIPCFITILLSIIFTIFFYLSSLEQNIMITYYNTFSRIFSLLFGVSLGFIHSYYGPLVLKFLKNKKFTQIFKYVYLLILCLFFVLVDANSPFFAISMILVTIITCRLIDYAIANEKQDLSIFDKVVKSLSGVSYEIYLLQYPLIFLFQYININSDLKIIIIIVLIFLLSYLLHFSFNFKNKKFKIVKLIFCVIILVFVFHGAYKYHLAEDYTKEMNILEQQLAENEKLILEKQKEYASFLEQEEADWMQKLTDLENAEIELKNIVSNLSIVGIGDSVMLGTAPNLYNQFPNGYFDAKTSRTAWVANDILLDLKSKNLLGDVILLNLGANGDCDESCKIQIIETCEGRDLFWINTPNYEDVNEKLFSLESKYENLHIIDWYSISNGHYEYFIADGIHLTEIGKEAYTKAIYDSIYQVYLEKYEEEKEIIMKEYEENKKNKISFYGNDLLLNAFYYIQNAFPSANFVIDKKFNYETLKNEIEEAINNDSLTNKIVFAFDSTFYLTFSQYNELINLCEGREIYILNVYEESFDIDNEKVTVMNFYEEIKLNSNYLMADQVHLTDEGNIHLGNLLKTVISS